PVTQGLKLWFDAGDVASLTNVADGSPVTSWHDLSGSGLEATPLFGAAPVYRANSLSGRAGVDFGLSGSDSLATAVSNRLNFTNCTIFVVGNRADSGTHISISAASVMQEYCIFDKGIQHHSSPYHYIYRSHQNSPPGFYIQAAVFGRKPDQLASFINGVASTAGFVFGQQSPTLDDVADYAPVARQAILGWRNSDADGNPPVASENFSGAICEVLVYDRQVTGPELDAVNLFLSNKYGIPATPTPPVLQILPAATGTFALQWDATPGRTYQVQTLANLGSTNWISLGSPFVAPTTPISLTNAIGTDIQRFFRIGVQ
ncbi:MAG: hypothetical protein NT154_27415, partial [Verrucomicrobia bacterium]|nr:hypothetical protein [Verrucomicrobiota bacterium]